MPVQRLTHAYLAHHAPLSTTPGRRTLAKQDNCMHAAYQETRVVASLAPHGQLLLVQLATYQSCPFSFHDTGCCSTGQAQVQHTGWLLSAQGCVRASMNPRHSANRLSTCSSEASRTRSKTCRSGKRRVRRCRYNCIRPLLCLVATQLRCCTTCARQLCRKALHAGLKALGW